jgi:HD superfamily phosphohydrolase
VAISPKGITALENILFSKYLMYKTVYWHKTVRIATAMIKKAIATALAAGIIRKEDLYGLDDEEFFARFGSARSPGFRLIEDTRNRLLMKQVLTLPFRDANPAHLRLEDIGARLALEQVIAKEAGRVLGREVPADCIVVDVPERISFDLDIPVIDPGRAEPKETRQERGTESHAGEASFIFDRLGHEELPRSLRTIAVSARRDDDLLDALGMIDLGRHFEA